MESFLPKCECGSAVMYEYYQVPHYDESGGLETVKQEVYFHDECENCHIYRVVDAIDVVDELPF